MNRLSFLYLISKRSILAINQAQRLSFSRSASLTSAKNENKSNPTQVDEANFGVGSRFARLDTANPRQTKTKRVDSDADKFGTLSNELDSM